jgi:hypothetical protein
MKSALFLLPLLLGASGCVFHIQGSRNALGTTDVQAPPNPLTRPTPPEDPGQRGIAFYGAANGGLVGHERDIGGVLGGELGFYPYTLEHSGHSWVNDQPMRAFGGAIGWSVFRGSKHNDNDSFGPLYAEARAVVAMSNSPFGSSRFGLGAAFNPQTLNAGPQASACIGIHAALFYACLRGNYMFGSPAEGPELYFYFEFASFLEYSWSK